MLSLSLSSLGQTVWMGELVLVLMLHHGLANHLWGAAGQQTAQRTEQQKP
jgi:hypothetical protein